MTTIGPTPERLAKAGKRKRSASARPGYEGSFEIGSREVDDPYEPGKKISVPWNLRHDPLARMLARNEIDEAQYQAGQELRRCVEMLGGSGAPAVDPSKEYVDGGRGYQGPTQQSIDAAKRLKQAQLLLGWQTYRLVRSVVCDGLNGTIIAQLSAAKVDRKSVQVQVRLGLEQIAILWNYLSNPRHLNAKASMVAMLTDRPEWLHEETNLVIEYSSAKTR